MLAPGITCAERGSPRCIENANFPSGKPASEGILIEFDCLRIPQQLREPDATALPSGWGIKDQPIGYL